MRFGRLLKKCISLFCTAVLCVAVFAACAPPQDSNSEVTGSSGSAGLIPAGRMDLLYADQFSVDYYEGGYSLVTIKDSGEFLLVPEGAAVPEGLSEDTIILQLPLQNIYLAASAAMDLFRKLGALDSVRMTGTKASDWAIPEIAEMVESGQISYGGKYSAPDYEMLLSNSCDLAIESTMIYHTPKVKEQLERIGIPVMVERSSYETHPLGRVEWIRLYGLLTGKEAEAESFMEECSERFTTLTGMAETGSKKSVAFFYVASNGAVNVRKPGDYISKMIELAGGEYIFADLIPEEENALSTVNMQMEAFYEKAVDADILIYNSTVQTELKELEELMEKSELFRDFKAVKEGNVWCTGQNMYQEITGTIDMLEDFYSIINDGQDAEPVYLHLLK